jgi:mono/diheme cytochrome c family protein
VAPKASDLFLFVWSLYASCFDIVSDFEFRYSDFSSMRFKLTILGFFFLAATCTALYLMFSGPRMIEQPKLVPFRAEIAPLPEGVVPVTDHYLRASDIAPDAKNPVEPNAANLEAGRVYYGYYCAVCHGAAGRGDGTVGQSYMPEPPPLASEKVSGMTDGQLYRAMLEGIGHEPVLEYTIPNGMRWYIVTYVRQLQKQTPN